MARKVYRSAAAAVADIGTGARIAVGGFGSVSYTHLTLPTILRV